MKQCPNCGAQIADDSRFCAECGKEVTQGNVCPHCGASMNDGDVYCQNCGKKPTDTPIEANEAVYEGEKKSGFKKFLPYILGAVVVLVVIGYFNSKDSKGGGDAQTVAVDTMAIDSVATADETPITNKNCVIADYDERMIYQGEYVFDAILTDAALEKKKAAFNVKIEGNKVSIPHDGKTMTGYIYNDDLGIDVFYDYGDDLHYISMRLKPNDKEGREWVGELQPTGLLYNVVLKLKESKQQGEAIKVTKEREAESVDEAKKERNLDWLDGHWVYEQGNYKGHFIIWDDLIKVYSSMNPEPVIYGYRIEGSELKANMADGVNLNVPIDFENHRIDYGDGRWMHKVDSSNDSYSSRSSSNSSSSRTFQSEQLVIGYLANQSFRSSDGLTMKVDGSGRLYVDGEYAGVLSVLRYNSTSALLRYGGGMYGEGKLTVQIVGDKFTLTDPSDGTVYYQR